MRFPVKLAIGSGAAMVFIIAVGFIAFPKMLKSKIQAMTALIPENDIRGMFVNVPFGLDFKVYIFNVTNPMEVQGGGLPSVKQLGPYCYKEWKTKIDISDNDEDDVMYYKAVDTFIADPGPGCASTEDVVTVLHPLIVGMVNAVMRQKPGAIGLVAKALKSIFRNPESIYLTAKVKDFLFEGVDIQCDVTDFAGKAVCSQLREAEDLKHVSDTLFQFSIMGAKNGTPSKEFKVYRGKKVNRNVGAIITYDGKPAMETWPTKLCNEIRGTDGTIFAPMMKKEEGLVSYAPDLCRSLAATFERYDHYDGIPVSVFTASLGDMSKNADEKCYCYTEDTCLKKGLMDLYKCAGVPVYVSFPHFYDAHESYVKGIKGLNPNKKDHAIQIMFEPTTGGPVAAAKRLQFNMPIGPNEKVDVFKNLPEVVHPMFWVEEGVMLNDTFTKPIKDFFKIKKIVKISKWLILLGSLAGLAAAGYLYFIKKDGSLDVTPVHKVAPMDSAKPNGISRVNGLNGHVNHAMSDNEIDKY